MKFAQPSKKTSRNVNQMFYHVERCRLRLEVFGLEFCGVVPLTKSCNKKILYLKKKKGANSNNSYSKDDS